MKQEADRKRVRDRQEGKRKTGNVQGWIGKIQSSAFLGTAFLVFCMERAEVSKKQGKTGWDVRSKSVSDKKHEREDFGKTVNVKGETLDELFTEVMVRAEKDVCPRFLLSNLLLQL